jgi:hypothetical protein
MQPRRDVAARAFEDSVAGLVNLDPCPSSAKASASAAVPAAAEDSDSHRLSPTARVGRRSAAGAEVELGDRTDVRRWSPARSISPIHQLGGSMVRCTSPPPGSFLRVGLQLIPRNRKPRRDIADQLVDDRRQVGLFDVLEHVGADHARRTALRLLAELLDADIVAVGQEAAPALVVPAREILVALAAPVIEQPVRLVLLDQLGDGIDIGAEAVAGEPLVRTRAFRRRPSRSPSLPPPPRT